MNSSNGLATDEHKWTQMKKPRTARMDTKG